MKNALVKLSQYFCNEFVWLYFVLRYMFLRALRRMLDETQLPY